MLDGSLREPYDGAVVITQHTSAPHEKGGVFEKISTGKEFQNHPPPTNNSHRTTHHHEYRTPTETMSITIQPTSVWDIRPGDPVRHMHSTWIVTQTHHHGAGFTIDLQRTDRKRMPRLLRTHWTEDLTLDLVEKKNS